MIKTLNLQRQTTAILENAYNIGYEKETNAIWQASFSLPLNDPKNEEVKLLQYVEITDDDEYIGLFRIIPKRIIKNESTNEITYQCEHVLATLLDSSLFQYHQLTNYTTEQVLQYLLDQQKEKHWQLGTVEFTRFFHYSWENENVLSALFSVPNIFDEPYRWTWNTTSYPWTLNLVRPETEPTCRIKEGYNLRGLEIEENPMSVYNRIYPLGAGEGVNQLTIRDVNNGIPYIEDTESITENGLKETIWVDQRFEDAASLKASAEALLQKWKEPIVSWSASAADVSKITGIDVDKLKEGRIVRLEIDGYPKTDLRIIRESKSDITGTPGDVQLEIGNLTEDLSTTQTDLERRQQINELYSMGATNILSFNYQDNCDSNIPALIPFYIDDDVVNINTCELTFRTKKFRAYSQATEGGGAVVKSTSSGGGTTATSSSGGGVSTSTSSGGGTVTSSESGGEHYHRLFVGGSEASFSYPKREFFANFLASNVSSLINIESSHDDDIYTYEAAGEHTHSINLPAHTHDFSVPNHTHNVTIPNHTHDIELPDHTHDVKHEIIELNEMPSSVTIRVDGNVVPHTSITGDRIDLVDYMSKDSSGKIIRGRHEVTIHPDGLARIEADLILRVFIRSHLGGNY